MLKPVRDKVTSKAAGPVYQPAQPPLPQGDDEIDLLALARTVWRGKSWIALAALIGLLLGGWYAFRVAIPIYTATAVVSLTSQQQSIVNFDSVLSGLGGDQASVNTEIEVIRSRQLIEKVVATLDLLEDPEFNAAIRVHEPGPRDWIGRVVPPFAPPISEPTSPERALDRTVDAVLRSLSVTNVRQSMVFLITLTTEDPVKSARLANAVAEAYIADQVEAKLEATARATEWLSERMVELRVQFEAAQEQLREFTTSSEIVTREGLAALNRQVTDLRERILAFEAQAAQAAGVTQTRLLAQTEALRQSLAELEDQIGSQSDDLAERLELESEVEQFRVLFEYFQTRLRETAVQQGIQQADARILSRAVVPVAPTAPRKPMILALSLLLGLMAGVGFVLVREVRHTGIRNAEELETATGLVVMGQLPSTVEIHGRSKMLTYLSNKPTSRFAEAVRNLRTSILRSRLDATSRIILSTSSVPGEGKTTISMSLAHSLSSMGQKVLLVECDLRRRTFSTQEDGLGFSEEFGLLAVLAGEATLDDVVQNNAEFAGVDVLAGDRGQANPVDVFSSDVFDRFLKEVAEKYDIVILDAPPVLAVPEARVLAPKADTVLYAVKWDDTARAAVREGLRLLETVGQRPSGLVLTQLKLNKMARYGYGDYARYGKGYYAS